MRAELKVSTVILLIVFLVFVLQFGSGIVFSQSYNTLRVESGFGTADNFAIGTKISITCFGNIEVYKDGELKEKSLGTLEYILQESGEYLIKCGDETKIIIVKDVVFVEEPVKENPEIFVKEETKIISEVPAIPIKIVTTVTSEPEILPVTNFSTLSIKTLQPTQKCASSECSLIINSPTKTLVDSAGVHVNFTDVVDFEWNNNSFYISWPNSSLELQTFAIYKGTRYSFNELQNMFPGLEVGAVIDDYNEVYKYGLNISNISSFLAEAFEYVGLELVDVKGIAWDEIKKTEAGIIINDEIHLGFNDLLKDYNLSIVNKSTILIGGVGNKTELWLDPTIQLQTADTENLEDTYVNSRSNRVNTNYGGDTSLSLRDYQARRRRIYIKFNISEIPSGVVIDEAKFCIYLYSNGATSSASVHHVYDYTWDGQTETGITWNNQVCGIGFDDSGDCNLTAEDTQNINAVGWVCWNVANMVDIEYAAVDSNISLVLRTPESASLTADLFCSKESISGSPTGCSVSQRPYLNITYTDSQPPIYSNVIQLPSGNPEYGDSVQCNSTWEDNVDLSAVIFRSNYTGSWENYTPSNLGSVYDYIIPISQLTGGEVVGWNYWANDTAANWNNSMPAQSFTVQKATPTLNLYLNGTDDDVGYYQNDTTNFTVSLSVPGMTVELWTDLTGTMQLWDSGSSPLENLTKLDYSHGIYLIKGNFSGNENYTATEETHYLTITQDPVKPNIIDVSPVNQSFGLGKIVTVQANVTDNIAVDTVLLNLTPPGGSPEIYVMVNNSQDIYQYSFQVAKTGAYYYEIIANDTTGNIQIYDPYIYVHGNATSTVSVNKNSYPLNENVILNLLENKTYDNLENGAVQKKAGLLEPEWIVLTYDNFESGFGSYIDGGGDCSLYTGGTYAHQGSNAGNIRDNSGTSSSFYHTNGLDVDTPDYTSIKIDFWFYALSMDDDEDFWVRYSDDDGSSWDTVADYNHNTEFVNDLFYNETVYINETSYTFSTTSKIRFQCDATGNDDNVYIDEINVSATIGPPPEIEANTTYTNYTEVISGALNELNKIEIIVDVPVYDNSGSTLRGNNNSDLQLELYDGSDWVLIGNFNVTGTGNVSLFTTNLTILESWETEENRDLRIRGINFDYYNSSNIDEINWTGVWVNIYNGSSILNTGQTNISGYLLMQVQTNSSGLWNVVDTVINDTNVSLLRNISAGEYFDIGSLWNANPWNTGSSPSGTYRVYAALTDDNGNVLQGDDGVSIEGNDLFKITVFGTINATPQIVGYSETVLISAEMLDTTANKVYVYIARPGESYTGYEMINISETMYQYNYSNTWIGGEYLYYIWSNNSAGYNSTSEIYPFYVVANAAMYVATVNDTYGPNNQVNLTDISIFNPIWWNSSWSRRKEINLSNAGSTDLINFPVYLNISKESEMLVNCNDVRFIDNSTLMDYEIEYCGDNNLDVWVRIPNLSTGTTTIYMYYGNSNANSAENITGVWDNNYTGVWHLSENGTNVRKDSTSNANNANPGNGVAHLSSAVVDGGDDFDGLDDYLESVNDAGITGNSVRTIEFWLNIDNTDRCGIIGWGEDGSSQHFEIAVRTNHWFLWGWGGGNDWNTGVTPVTDVWTHHAIVHDGTTLRWYVGGSELASGFTHTYDTADSHIYFGIEDDIGSLEYMNGFLDEVRISNTVRSMDWINQTKEMAEYQSSYVDFGEEEEYIIESKLTNTGSYNLTGYLLMRIQQYSGGTWNDYGIPVVDDWVPRTIIPGNSLDISAVWVSNGAWDTDSHDGGLYRVHSSIRNPDSGILTDTNGYNIEATYNFTIISAELLISNVEHENEYTYGVNEYELEDTLEWINITITSKNATALNANISLNILDNSDNKVSWGPDETKSCGTINKDETCEKRFDNSTQGYFIPSDAATGTYDFKWNISLTWDPGGNYVENHSYIFKIHDLKQNVSSVLDPSEIDTGEFTAYNFTINNPFSENLTDVAVKINCPNILGLVCVCEGTTNDYCDLGNISSGSVATFNISTNSSTPAGDYNINATLNYTNPGSEFHSREELQNKILEVRVGGAMDVNITYYPVKITRGNTTDLKGYVINENSSQDALEVVSNWTLPSNWVNTTGNLNKFVGNLSPSELDWNNITVNLLIGAELGQQQVELESTSDNFGAAWKIRYITVHANTSFANIGSNNSDPVRGETIQLSTRLLYDNGSVMVGETVSFRDETASQDIGSDTTDSGGWARANYIILGGASVGTHTINITYLGSETKYTNSRENTTTITVHDVPLIMDISATPQIVGYGYNVTIQVNVTDEEGVDLVRVYITDPDSQTNYYSMTNNTEDIYEYNFTNTWQLGTYIYYIWTNDTAGKTNQSVNHYFYVKANASIKILTEKNSYEPNKMVNLTACGLGSWEDNFSDETKINSSLSSDYDITDGTARLNETAYSTTYDFDSCTTGTDCWAWSVESNNAPPESNPNSEVAATSTDYTAIAISGGTRWQLPDPGVGDRMWIRTQMRLAQNASKITRINFTGEGYGSVDVTSRVYVCNLTANTATLPNCSSWIQVVQQQVTQNPPDTTVEGSLTSGFLDVVNGSGHILWIWGSETTSEYLYVDYVKLDVEYDGYELKGNLTSVPITPTHLAGWDKFFVEATVQTGTEVTYNLLDTSDNSVLCAITSAEASSGYDIHSCASGASSIKVYANMSTTNTSSSPIITNWNVTWNNGSCLSNIGSTDITGYLLMQVYSNVSGDWVVVNTTINETFSRKIISGEALDLAGIWNTISWNTSKETPGSYRIYAVLRDSSGNVLQIDNGSGINGSYEFNIISSSIDLSLQEIKIYDVTGKDTHSDISDLIGNGLNKSFNLYTSKVYRVELIINNDENSSAGWSIQSSDSIFHEYLNDSWTVDGINDIWYSNSTHNFTGGNFSVGKINWNTSLGGSIGVGNNITFYYVVNITLNGEDYGVHFKLETSSLIEEDYSNYHIILYEGDPPVLYNNLYDLSTVDLYRGNSLVVYARWNESINESQVEFNSTTSSFQNYTMTLPSPNPQNWTNYTIDTNSTWLVGEHSVKIYAKDLSYNWNDTLDYLIFTVWGLASLTNSSLDPSVIQPGQSTTMRCRVTDDNSTPISDYTVSFYNSTGLLGTNTTNSTGWAEYSFVDNSLGFENITCNITDPISMYYDASSQDGLVELLETSENQPPNYSNVGPDNGTVVHKNDPTIIYSYWQDNFELCYAILSTNETGVWENKTSYGSPMDLNDTGSWANFTWSNISITPGEIYWKIYANDTFGNLNQTNIFYLNVWGWSEISEHFLNPSTIEPGNSTTMFCKVRDADSSASIFNYTVSFYNSTGLLGTNTTNSTGWAEYSFVDNSLGYENITCNITDASFLYYNASSQNEGKSILDTKTGDTKPPVLYNDIYDLNDTVVWKGESVLVYARWNESINESQAEFNSTTDSFQNYTITLPSLNPQNWTNYTIDTDSTWLVGEHSVKIYTKDQNNNWNDSLPYKNFYVWGKSNLTWNAPTGSVYRGDVTFSCNVTDIYNSGDVANYLVYFYNSTASIGSNTTDENGTAYFTYDISEYPVGSNSFSCKIYDAPSIYYNTSTGIPITRSNTLTVKGLLNTTIAYPAANMVFHRGETIDLNSTTIDENSNSVTPDSVLWHNSTSQIATGEDTNWTIPVDYKLGPETIKVNSSKIYYDDGINNVSIEIWGWSNITWGTPAGGNYSVGTLIDLTCSVKDVNTSDEIENYPVYFYYQNSTEGGWHFISLSTTNLTGIAIVSWDTSGLSADNYTTMCNITHNSTVYYNTTEKNEANATIGLNSSVSNSNFEVSLMLPPSIPGKGDADSNEGYKVGMDRIFVLKANVTCRGGDCGVVQGTIRYNSSGTEPDTAVSVGYATPFYVIDSSNGTAQNPVSCGTLNENESCLLNWTINSTGNLHTLWNLDVLFTGTQSSNNNTNNTKIDISIVLIMSLSNNQLSATVEPSWPSVNKVELAGGPVYVTINENSNDAEGIYIKGSNLTGPSGYSIYVENMSYAFVNNSGVGADITESYQDMVSPAPAGTNQSTYYWINTPQGITTGYYYGYIYIMANATG